MADNSQVQDGECAGDFSAVIRVIRICRNCGAKIFSDAPEGLCTGCVLEAAIGIFPEAPVAGVDDPGQPASPMPATARNDVVAASKKKATYAAEMLGELGDYELLEEIGRGGQGVVFRARQKSLNRIVALKVVSLGQWASKAHLKRFRLEAEAAAKLEHPSIVPIHEVGERDGSCYFSMKFVEGGQLDEVARREPIPIRRAVELIAKVARTVHYAHEHGILHRDIKPGNILLDAKGEPHLTDFGLARLVESESSVTQTLDVLGTPSYMAPEQAVGNNAAVSSATDVYGLGAVLYQLLTGQPPFAGGATYETIKLLLDSEPRQPRLINPKIDRDLSTICLKCLEKDPKRRYSSALALAEDLEHWLKHEPIRAQRTGPFSRGRKWVRRNPSIAVMAAMLLAMAVPLGVMIWKSGTGQLPTSNPAAPEKSIAVLPFSNLSKEPENAFFADGMQDEILTDLARIADLKVVSRTSVMHYESGTARYLREIGQQLGVANVVEGSVQRSGNRVRVNAQLVDTRTDRHLWAQTYDRDLADVFAIQSEIAKTIADQLQAKLSPSEKSAIERPPTSDVTAFDLYTRGKNLILTVYSGSAPSKIKADLLQAIDLLNQVVARDPSFFEAYCWLTSAHDSLYIYGFDHTPARLALAEAAVQAAFRLHPDAGETHLARAQNLYQGYLNYDGALAELELARQTLPNDSRILALTGFIQRRQGRWEESTRNLERAIELDPHNFLLLTGTAQNYYAVRRYTEQESVYDRILAFEPNHALTKVQQGLLELDSKADARPLHQIIDSIRATDPAATPIISNNWLRCALSERDAAAAKNALIALGDNSTTLGGNENVLFNRPFVEGVIARMTTDDEKARSAFTAAGVEQEKIVQAQPNYAQALCVLGLIDAGLGRKEEALREGRRAVALLPVEKDAAEGAVMIKYLAMTSAWVGDKDLACEQLAIAVHSLSGLTYGQLKLLPFWDPLRGDPRFEKLLEEVKQPLPIATSAPEKSIAVLPFENRSRDPDNAYFADGVQDEILTDLARIADLKVISRTSVMNYKSGTARNLREISRQLDVAHVVEGSVQRTGNRVRVNAQLLDARTDRHLWAQTYDRDLADVFAVQSEIAKTIADQLQAKLSPSEKGAIERAPTSDITAFDFYARAKNLLVRFAESSTAKANLLQAVDLLNQAAARDPSFFEVYCQLAYACDALYWYGLDHTSARVAMAEAAIQAAARLRPDAGETHLARAQNLYWGYRDYDGALAELEVAGQTLPNNAQILRMTGLIQRRQGRWKESTPNLERSIELNPRDIELVQSVAIGNYMWFRRYAESKSLLARALVLEPNDAPTKTWLANMDLYAKGDTLPLHQTIDSIRATNPAAVPSIANDWLLCALAERDAAAAKAALLALGDNPVVLWHGNVQFNRSFAEGLIARMRKDDDNARSAFTAARAEQERIVQAQPNYGPALCVLGLIDAGLGRKEDALREGRRAVELLPVEKDAVDGPGIITYLAMIAAWVGDKDLACEQLGIALRIQSGLSYGELKLMPWWDPLRGDPRFEKIVEEAKQPVALK